MLYVDTSVLVAALAAETGSDRAQYFLAEARPNDLFASAWVTTEFSSALALKLRVGQIDERLRSRLLNEFTSLVAGSFRMLGIEQTHFHAAAQICDRSELRLRSGDALHLAIAIAYGATMVTLDANMHAGVSGEALPVRLL